MADKFTIRMNGIDKAVKAIDKLSNDIHEVEDATLIRTGELAKETARSGAPQSIKPRGPNISNDRQNWRTGIHAITKIRATKPFYDESGEKIVEVGVPMNKRGRTPYFYLRILEVGGYAGKIPALRFFERARMRAAAEMPNIAAEEIRRRLL